MNHRPPASPVPLRADARGVAVVEMAITLPILLTLLMGIISYGDWMFTAHAIQQAANEGARAAIAGLSASERASLAETTIDTNLRRTGALNVARATAAVSDDGTTLVVRLSYDASADPLLHLTFIPMPPLTVTRSAAITLGGL